MALFWSKKPKATKNYDKAAVPAVKSAAGKAPSAKAAKAVKAIKPAKAGKASKETAVAKAFVPTVQSGSDTSAASVIIRPRVTEKSGLLSQSNVYTFEVSKASNKQMISKAVIALYKVTPIKVAIVNSPAKHVFVKGRKGVVSGIKKALVTVKTGDKIDFV